MFQKYQQMQMDFWNAPKQTSKMQDQLEPMFILSFPLEVQPLAKRFYEKVSMVEFPVIMGGCLKAALRTLTIGIMGGLILTIFLKLVLHI